MSDSGGINSRLGRASLGEQHPQHDPQQATERTDVPLGFEADPLVGTVHGKALFGTGRTDLAFNRPAERYPARARQFLSAGRLIFS